MLRNILLPHLPHNSLPVRVVYPMPRIDEYIDRMAGSSAFIKRDLRSTREKADGQVGAPLRQFGTDGKQQLVWQVQAKAILGAETETRGKTPRGVSENSVRLVWGQWGTAGIARPGRVQEGVSVLNAYR